MIDLSTSYMGLTLRNPLVVSSSNLTSKVEDVVACEAAGAGAVVLKSLFEEQILADTEEMVGDFDTSAHPEALAFFSGMGANYHMDAYLKLVRESKERVKIPVIASINCISAGAWLRYAQDFEKVGADALELNLFILPSDVNKEGSELEEAYLEICREVKRRVTIPVSLKIGPHFSSLAGMVKTFIEEGIAAIVLFNRFYRPDVDIETMTLKAAHIFSSPYEMSESLRWIALLSGELAVDFAASTGVYDSQGVVKQILVGARVVQLCSTLYKNGIEYMQEILSGLQQWMQENDYSSIDEFRGKLNQESIEHPEVYERAQYVKALVGIE